MPAPLAPPPGARRHPRFARRTAARAREGGVAAQVSLPAASAAASAASPASTSRAPAANGAAVPAADEAAPAAHSPDEAWIETARCPSCNECQLINDRMFAYDERKQAYIKDVGAGTYRQPGRGCRKLPGRDHPSRQAARSERARLGRAARTGGAVSLSNDAWTSRGNLANRMRQGAHAHLPCYSRALVDVCFRAQHRPSPHGRGCVKTRLGLLWRNNDALDRFRIDFLYFAKGQRTPESLLRLRFHTASAVSGPPAPEASTKDGRSQRLCEI